MNNFFSERLSVLRLKKNVSAREMSLALGQNASYINRIENRMAFPSMQVFFYMCEYLEVTPQELFETDMEHFLKNRKISSLFSHLTDTQTDAVIHLIESFLEEEEEPAEKKPAPPQHKE